MSYFLLLLLSNERKIYQLEVILVAEVVVAEAAVGVMAVVVAAVVAEVDKGVLVDTLVTFH